MNETLLKLQIGPVQEFIAQARSTRDLWSGSYLLSWLMATGINALFLELIEAGVTGSDLKRALVFPEPELQPLLQFRQPGLFASPPSTNAASRNAEFLTPSLPNIFLALLPFGKAKAREVAETVATAIGADWKEIARRSWLFCERNGLVENKVKNRFDHQVDRLLYIAWQVEEMVSSNKAEAVLASLPGGVATVAKLSGALPKDQAFAATLALNSWELDAVRQVRHFKAWTASSDPPGTAQEKDSQSGREEQIVGGADWWQRRVGTPQLLTFLFRERHKSEYLGAVNLIKRVWHLAYLKPVHDLHAGHDPEWRGVEFPFPSTFHIASHDPAKHEEEAPTSDELPDRLDRYFAVLAMDADEMGQWMSGAKFDACVTDELLRDFSGRLSQFGLNCARPIVEACDGRLIYSGGDDVLALLPADTALQCAGFLRQAFKAEPGFVEDLKSIATALIQRHRAKAAASKVEWKDYHRSPYLEAAAAGRLFARAERHGSDLRRVDTGGELTLPVQAEISTGLAIAHFKAPLQDVVRAAQAAEKRAKKQLGRSAIAVTLLKRSGETIEWGCQWEGRGLELHHTVFQALQNQQLSAKFAHRVVELLHPYLTVVSQLTLEGRTFQETSDFKVTDIVAAEMACALERQCPLEGQARDELAIALKSGVKEYVTHLNVRYAKALEAFAKQLAEGGAASWQRPREVDFVCQAVIGLCDTVAFAHRGLENDETEGSSASSAPPSRPAKPPAESRPA